MFVKIYLVYWQGKKKINQFPVQDQCNTKYEFLGSAQNIIISDRKKDYHTPAR